MTGEVAELLSLSRYLISLKFYDDDIILIENLQLHMLSLEEGNGLPYIKEGDAR